MDLDGPHGGQPLLLRGERPALAQAGLVLLHGRGASAEDILLLGEEVSRPGLALVAPQAAGASWYPNRFIAPTASNEPWLSSALGAVAAGVALLTTAGLPAERIILAGFSQGACLVLEYAARHARRYGGVAGLSGGLIGAPGEARLDQGDLDGTPVLLGCSDADPHIPLERVEWSARKLETLGGRADLRIYPGLGHSVNTDELGWLKRLVMAVAG